MHYDQLLHHTCMHCLLLEDMMKLEKRKWLLILVPQLKRGEKGNPFVVFYHITMNKQQYPTVTISQCEDYQVLSVSLVDYWVSL